MKRITILNIVLMLSLNTVFCQKWEYLFTQADKPLWKTYLENPHHSDTTQLLQKLSTGKYPKIGHNKDPLKVFSIYKDKKKEYLRVSGQVFGTVSLDRTFQNYHLILHYRWGEKKWAPRTTWRRDSGLIYHGFGLAGEHKFAWFHGHELQIQEHDTGDYWPTGEVTLDIPAAKTDTAAWYAYNPNESLKTVSFHKLMENRRVIKKQEADFVGNKWNKVELYCFGDSIIHVVNNKVVLRAYNSKKATTLEQEALKSGKIGIQSEGAEVYYKKIKIKTLTKKPKIFNV
jgi:hypothetical protein